MSKNIYLDNDVKNDFKTYFSNLFVDIITKDIDQINFVNKNNNIDINAFIKAFIGELNSRGYQIISIEGTLVKFKIK